MTEQIERIRARMLIAQSRQKDCARRRRKPLEVEEGGQYSLRVTPTTSVGRAIKTEKLNSRYMVLFNNFGVDWNYGVSSSLTISVIKLE